MGNLARVETSQAAVLLQDQINFYVEHSKAPNTVRAYKSDWRHFENWCSARSVPSLPTTASTVALYLAYYAESNSISTLSRRFTTIREAHKSVGVDLQFLSDPQLDAVWTGIKRTVGIAQNGKQPLLTQDIRELIRQLPENITGIRDRAILLLGFCGGFRRSELVSLNVSDLHFSKNGIEVILRRSKTDQEGQGMTKAIPFASSPELCPVRALTEWLTGIEDGPLFVSIGKGQRITTNRLSDKSVSLIIKKYAAKAGLQVKELSGHSLRSGFASQAAINGASDRAIMNQTGHRTRAMVDKYVRRATVWQDNAATSLGL
jgi:site-specific recombinase XerD